MLPAPKDILKGFADGLPQVLQLLPKHHALGRADAAVELVVFHAKVLARVEHVIGQPEAKVKNRGAEGEMGEQVGDALRSHEVEVVVSGLLQELPVSVVNWTGLEAHKLRVKDHVEVVRQRVDKVAAASLRLAEGLGEQVLGHGPQGQFAAQANVIHRLHHVDNGCEDLEGAVLNHEALPRVDLGLPRLILLQVNGAS